MADDNVKKFQYGGVAGEYALGKDLAGAQAALELLAQDGLKLGDDAQGFIDGAFASQQGIATAVGVYNGKYSDAKGDLTVGEYQSRNKSYLDGLKDDEKKKINGILEKYKDKKIKEIMKDYNKAKATAPYLEGDEKTKAEETLKKYEEVAQIIQVIEKRHEFASLRHKVEERAGRKELSSLV